MPGGGFPIVSPRLRAHKLSAEDHLATVRASGDLIVAYFIGPTLSASAVFDYDEARELGLALIEASQRIREEQ